VPEAIASLRRAIDLQPDYVDARHLLMLIYARLGDRENLRAQAAATLETFPSDTVAASWLARAPTLPPASAKAERPAPGPGDAGAPTAEGYLNQSLILYNAGRYTDSIAAAREALRLRPTYAAAWNNIMANYNSMADWDNAIAAGEMALRLDPMSQLAKNNLARARAQKEKAAAAHQ
jgi:tetratricopeptide (TPR) repeat protein